MAVLIAASAGLYALTARSTPDPARQHQGRRGQDRSGPQLCVATYPVGQRPGPVVSNVTAVWVGNLDDRTATRIDTATGLTQTTGTVGSPTDLALDPAGNAVVLIQLSTSAGASTYLVGVVDAWVRRILELRKLPPPDPTTFSQPLAYRGITYSAGRAWITNAADGVAVRMALGAAGLGFRRSRSTERIRAGPWEPVTRRARPDRPGRRIRLVRQPGETHPLPPRRRQATATISRAKPDRHRSTRVNARCGWLGPTAG